MDGRTLQRPVNYALVRIVPPPGTCTEPTKRPFIVFTSNVFAILGLRSLYFVLAGAIKYFRFLKYGLSLVLVFIGIKMLIDPNESEHPYVWQNDIPTSTSLIVVGGIIGASILLSVLFAKRAEPKTQ